MSAPAWPGAELAAARSVQQVVRRQVQASAVLGGLALVWRLGPVPKPEPLLGYVIFGVAVALVAEIVVGAAERDRAARCADDLIEAGFVAAGRSDPVSRAVQERVHQVLSERNRRRVASALCWRLELGTPPPAGLGAHADRVRRIAAAVERGPCDARALVRLNRLLGTPEPPGHDGPDAVGHALDAVLELLGESTHLDRIPAPQAGIRPRGLYPGPHSESGRRISMDTVSETIEEARRLLVEGNDKRAADLLTSAAAECGDERRAAMIRALAVQGRERAGRFGKRRWDEAIRLSDEHLARVGP
jgi:hypothetical protein